MWPGNWGDLEVRDSRGRSRIRRDAPQQMWGQTSIDTESLASLGKGMPGLREGHSQDAVPVSIFGVAPHPFPYSSASSVLPSTCRCSFGQQFPGAVLVPISS